MIKIDLLKITDRDHEEIDRFFDTAETFNLDQIAPRVVDGQKEIMIGDRPIEEWDACFAEIPQENAVFGRVLLEMIEEKNIPVNQSSTAFFISAKKNYLSYILSQRGIDSPKTTIIASENASRNLEKEIKSPLIARKLEDMKETEKKMLESSEDIHGFAEGTEYSEDLLIFQELTRSDKHRCLVIGDQIISLGDSSDGWKIREENLKYSNISDSQRESVMEAVRKIGISYGEIYLRGTKIYNINPRPDLKLYERKAGKNIYEAVADILKEES